MRLYGRNHNSRNDTKKVVALKHEESEDQMLIHRPHDEVSKMLQAQVLQNISRKFDVSTHLLHMFRVNQALWGTFMNSCMLGAVYLSKDEEDFKHTMEVRNN